MLSSTSCPAAPVHTCHIWKYMRNHFLIAVLKHARYRDLENNHVVGGRGRREDTPDQLYVFRLVHAYRSRWCIRVSIDG